MSRCATQGLQGPRMVRELLVVAQCACAGRRSASLVSVSATGSTASLRTMREAAMLQLRSQLSGLRD